MNNLLWKKYYPLTDKNAFICLVDTMGDDSSITQAARVSYGKDEQGDSQVSQVMPSVEWSKRVAEATAKAKEAKEKDRKLLRLLLRHGHTSPFEMVEFKFMVQVPMDHWRQWIRHRTANVNEYSTRYSEALDFFQITDPTEWRLQAIDNKQGSSGFLEEWPEEPTEVFEFPNGDGPSMYTSPGHYLTEQEEIFYDISKSLYQERLKAGIAKEQARKDLPLSTYTRAYWKCDLHNIFNFLRLRMDSHAQLEIRSYANSMFEIVKQVCPVACEAFEDYVLHAKKFSRMEMALLKEFIQINTRSSISTDYKSLRDKPDSMTDREWKEFLEKLK